MIKLLILTLTVLALSACGRMDSDNLRQEAIFTSYSAKFNEDTNSADFIAEYSIDSGSVTKDTVRLSGDSKILLNGKSMIAQEGLLGIHYFMRERNALTKLENSYEFEYTNNEKRVFKNSLKIPPPLSYQGPDQAVKSSGFNISWSIKDSLELEEKIETSIKYIDSYGHESYLYKMDTSSSRTNGSININNTDLEKVPTQRIELQVCRTKKYTDINAPSQGGDLQSSYCAASQSMLLK